MFIEPRPTQHRTRDPHSTALATHTAPHSRGVLCPGTAQDHITPDGVSGDAGAFYKHSTPPDGVANVAVLNSINL
jgi:hypothetical protein